MPTTKALTAVPPFPDNVPASELPRLSLNRLIENDAEQSDKLFQPFREHRFALLDMQGCLEGETVLAEAEKMFGITEVTPGLNLDEKLKYIPTKPTIFGFVFFNKYQYVIRH